MNNNDEFHTFLNSNEAPSEDLNSRTIAINKKQITIESYITLLKVFFIHLGAGAVTLTFCPQFGFNPLGADPHFAHKFMSYGAIVCGGFCGSIFMGSGTLLSIIFLRNTTLALYQKSLISKTSLIIVILIFIMMFFGNLDMSAYYMNINYLIGWFLTALIIKILLFKLYGNYRLHRV